MFFAAWIRCESRLYPYLSPPSQDHCPSFLLEWLRLKRWRPFHTDPRISTYQFPHSLYQYICKYSHVTLSYVLQKFSKVTFCFVDTPHPSANLCSLQPGSVRSDQQSLPKVFILLWIISSSNTDSLFALKGHRPRKDMMASAVNSFLQSPSTTPE